MSNQADVTSVVFLMALTALGCGRSETEGEGCLRSNEPWCAWGSADGGRALHTAVWSGEEVLIWGGVDDFGSRSHEANPGIRLNPQTGQVVQMSTIGAPTARYGHFGTWTGTEMLIWGGNGPDLEPKADGGLYDPTSDTWRSLDTPPGHVLAGVAWNGVELFVWGGRDETQPVASGFIFNSESGTTRGMGSDGGPYAIYPGVLALDSQVLVVGGQGDAAHDSFDSTLDAWAPIASGPTDVFADAPAFERDGAAYFCPNLAECHVYAPTTDTWSSVDIPETRAGWGTAWTYDDEKLVVFGGRPESSGIRIADGGFYDFVNETWGDLPDQGRPVSLMGATLTPLGDSTYLLWGSSLGGQTQQGQVLRLN